VAVLATESAYQLAFVLGGAAFAVAASLAAFGFRRD
jgi:hypothetical protein